MSLKTTLSSLSYLTLFLWYLRVWHFEETDPGSQARGKWYYYVTLWNLLFQTIYLSISVLNAMYKMSRGSDLVSSEIRFKLIHHLISPLTNFVFMVFWTLYFIKPSLLVPDGRPLSGWFNHSVHTLPILLPISELYLHRPSSGKLRWKSGVVTTCAWLIVAACGYLVYMEWMLTTHGIAFYPMYKQLDTSARMKFNSAMLVIVVPICALITEAIIGLVNIGARKGELHTKIS